MSSVEAYNAELSRFLSAFGQNVRKIRGGKRPPFSQERLSHATRLHRTEIGRLEQGAVEPRRTTLMILAEGLGVTVDDLLRGLTVPVERKPPPNGKAWP
jgi:transcriptional regulator with XRE-family HTH domain